MSEPESLAARGRALGVSRQRMHQIMNPEKHSARQQVQSALRTGRIERPSVCQECHSPGKTEAHHSDYAKPLDVRWLCDRCHTQAHKKDNTPRVSDTQKQIDRLRSETDPKFRDDMNKLADSLQKMLDGAVKGGKARAKKLKKSQRSEIARRAARARWGSKKSQEG